MADSLLTPDQAQQVVTLLTGGSNAAPDPNWTEVKEVSWPKDYKPIEGEQESFLKMVNVAKLGDEARKAVIDFHTKHQDASLKAVQEQFKEQQKKWANEATTQLGSNKEKTLGAANELLDKFGSPELMAMLQQTGLTNRIEMIQFLANVSEKLPRGAAPSAQASPSGNGADNPAYKRLFG